MLQQCCIPLHCYNNAASRCIVAPAAFHCIVTTMLHSVALLENYAFRCIAATMLYSFALLQQCWIPLHCYNIAASRCIATKCCIPLHCCNLVAFRCIVATIVHSVSHAGHLAGGSNCRDAVRIVNEDFEN